MEQGVLEQQVQGEASEVSDQDVERMLCRILQEDPPEKEFSMAQIGGKMISWWSFGGQVSEGGG